MYIQPTTTYGSLIPGSEYIRSLVRQGTISSTAAAQQKKKLLSLKPLSLPRHLGFLSRRKSSA